MGLIDSLLSFARGQEDVLTETLAWFLEHCAPFREATLGEIERLLRDHRLPLAGGVHGRPEISTQVVELDPKEGTCRYDLVMTWPEERVIFEVKVWADLTWRADSDGESRHQLARYLQTAAARQDMRTHLLVLAPTSIDEQLSGDTRRGFIGQLSWQIIHDHLLRVEGVDPTLRMLAVDFAESLEKRHMAIPKVTLEDMRAVVAYKRFHASLRVVLDAARDQLLRDGSLDGFTKNDSRDWQDDHGRIGWRLWARKTDTRYFAFIGIYAGPGTLVAEVPDLYFMLEAPPQSRIRSAFDAKGAEIAASFSTLGAGAGITWTFAPGGYETLRARRSLEGAAGETDHAALALKFFRTAIQQLKETTLWAGYLALARPLPPAAPQLPEPPP